MPDQSFTVTGMSCSGCEENVEEAVGELDGVSSVSADHETDSVEVVSEGTADEEIREAIETAGYDVAGA